MAKDASFKLFGLKELDEALRALPREIAKKVALEALREAAEPMLAEVRASASFKDKSGELRKSIQAKTLNRVRQGTFQLRVGPTAPHAHLIEYGTKAHRVDAKPGSVLATYNQVIGKHLDHPGQPPRPFFRPAWDRHVKGMLDSLSVAFWKALDSAAAKLAKQAQTGLPPKIAEQLR